ncbi:hypothetical protein RP20_CCG005291 [Aedes albopictus]|nr:hypothetical protein RP20_CCG005291 [Aedes albopictus]
MSKRSLLWRYPSKGGGRLQLGLLTVRNPHTAKGVNSSSLPPLSLPWPSPRKLAGQLLDIHGADHGVPPLFRLTLQHGQLLTGPVLGHMPLPTVLGPVLTGLERGQLPTGVPQLPRLPTMPESFPEWPAAHWGAPAASVAHHAGVVPGATSVTATRGAVHVAPLPGHAISQKQLNLAPAPGTL